MKNAALLIIAAIFFMAGAAFADTYKEEVINVQSGTTKLKLSGQLSDAAMDALSSGEQVSIQNNLVNYLCTPTRLSQNKKGFGKKSNATKISFKSKNGKFNWTEKDVSANFAFAIGNSRTRPTQAILKSSGTLATRNFADFDAKPITLFDMVSKENGLDRLAAHAFTPRQEGKNYKYSSGEQNIQVKFSANSKGKVNASYTLSHRIVSPALLGTEIAPTNQPGNYAYSLEKVGDGDVDHGFVGTNLVEFRVTRNKDKFRYYSYKGIKVTDDYMKLQLTEDTKVTAVFGNYNLSVSVSGKGSVSYEFVGQDEVIATAIPGEEEFDSFELNGTIYQENPLRFTMTGDTELIAIFKGTPPITDGYTYMVIDLSGGPNATSYPVSYLGKEPAGGWSDEYKTTKLVLRRITPGTFKMGSRVWEVGRSSDEIWHNVTLTKPYYIGVFEMTQKQYELVTGENPSYFKGDARPVHSVRYVDIRGDNEGVKWPMEKGIDENSFLWKLRSKTKLSFDLPTEAQWEYACRARTTVAWNNDKVSTSSDEDPEMNMLGRYKYNTGDGKGDYEDVAKVGSYLPNVWGLYDMHGNVREWCLDWYDSYSSDDAIDPEGPNYARNSYDQRVLRGGGKGGTSSSSFCKADKSRSAARDYGKQSSLYEYAGFRLSLATNDGEDEIFPPRVIGIDEDDIGDGDKGETKRYLIINLENGNRRYRDTEPEGGWPDLYKTTKIVFRRITPGTFKMGSRVWEVGRSSDEVWHNVTLTQPYYISVFEMTQGQYKQMVGGNPSYYEDDMRPVDSVRYVDIRGDNEGVKWPMSKGFDENSFLGRMQEITQLSFDLPTEAQWEYACRARTTVAWNNGKVSTGEDEDPEMNKLGRYYYNIKDGIGGLEYTTTVGSYLPNAWGLYDMHGNVREWCLDWYDSYSSDDAIDPEGPNYAKNSSNQRVLRGGGKGGTSSSSFCKADKSRSAARDYGKQSSLYEYAGFRLAIATDEGDDDIFPPDPIPIVENHPYLIVDLETGDTSYLDDEPEGGWPEVYKTTKLVLRYVPAGTFEMGSLINEIGRSNDEIQHKVTLTESYYISVFEMTQGQYKQIVGRDPSYYKGDVRPVDSVRYVDIRGDNEGVQWPMSKGFDENSFLGRMQEITQLPFDLPTEAQWEYACRAGTTKAWNSGAESTSKDEDPEMNKLGRYYYNIKDGIGGFEYTTTVGSYLPNAWGLYDMHGNVREWCLDWYDSYSSDDAIDPEGPNYAKNSSNQRVLRGGGKGGTSSSSFYKANKSRSAARDYGKQSSLYEYAGFRLVLIP